MTELVIDVGCKPYGHADSVKALVQHFQPANLLGLDPALRAPNSFMLGSTSVHLFPVAAWTRRGFVRFLDDGSGSHVATDRQGRRVEARDLASIIQAADGPVVLKLDCEGGEYDLIPHLIETGAYENVGRWLIEWHPDPIPGLPFEWEPWWM